MKGFSLVFSCTEVNMLQLARSIIFVFGYEFYE